MTQEELLLLHNEIQITRKYLFNIEQEFLAAKKHCNHEKIDGYSAIESMIYHICSICGEMW
jgi:hypothetical protein